MIENGANNEKEKNYPVSIKDEDLLVKSKVKDDDESSEDQEEMQKASDFVNAKIEDLGYGYYQWLYFFIFLYQQINEGIAACFLGFTLIPLKQFYHATNNEIEIASSTIFLSFGAGCFVIGFIKKILSRKEIIFYSIFLMTLSSTLILFFTSIEMYIILRMITNFCLGLSTIIFGNIFLEFLPVDMRHIFVLFSRSGFQIGMLILVLLMLIMTPDFNEEGFYRILITYAIMNFILLVFVFLLFQDSPRNLVVEDKEDEAREVLDKMLVKDNSTPNQKKEFKDKFCQTVKYANNVEENKSEPSLSEIFSEKYLKTTIIVGLSNIILNFNYFGMLILFTPSLEVIYSQRDEIKTKESKTIDFHSKKNNALEIINVSLISTLLRFSIVIILSFLSQMKSIGNLLLIRIMATLACIFSLLILVDPLNYSIYGTLSLILITNNVTYVSTLFYSTNIRDLAMGFILGLARFSSFISQIFYLKLFEISLMLPYYFMFGFNVVNLILYISWEDPTNKQIDSVSKHTHHIHADKNKKNEKLK